MNIMGYLGIGCGKPLSADALEVYFDLLGDLDRETLQIAAKRVLLEHRWATFPSVAELREAAALTVRGSETELTAAEAWELAWSAVGKMDLEIIGEYIVNGKTYANQAASCLDGLPSLVVEAMVVFGVPAMCYGSEPVGVIRGQFTKIFEQLAARDKRVALIPLPMRQRLEEISAAQPADQDVLSIAGPIGAMP